MGSLWAGTIGWVFIEDLAMKIGLGVVGKNL